MRHKLAGRKLGRNAEHRLALLRNLAMALIEHERIITTVEKAKEVRPFVEKLITLAKKGTLHARRVALSKLGPMGQARLDVNSQDVPEGESGDNRTIIKKLFDDIGPRFRNRVGGYTRIIKRQERRLGDAGRTAFIELLKDGELKVRARQPMAPAPAPLVSEPSPAPPAPEVSAPPAPETPAPTPTPSAEGTPPSPPAS